MIAFLVLCFTASVGNTNEVKENKVQTFINNEIQRQKNIKLKVGKIAKIKLLELLIR